MSPGYWKALAIPIPLSTEVTEILNQRRCPPAVLGHPYAPDHHILLTGERYGVLLPPTVTPRGPITWTRPPREDSLRLCREIDLFAALRTALNDGVGGHVAGDPLVGAARELDATDVSIYRDAGGDEFTAVTSA